MVSMEDLDRRILGLLSGNGRMSYTEIARQTGLSISAAQQRVRRLEQRGVIEGYSIKVSPRALGHSLTAFVFLTPFASTRPDDVPGQLEPMQEIVACWSVAGESSHMLMVQVGDTQHLEELLRRIREVAAVSTRTILAMSVPFADRPNLAPGPQRED